MTDKVSKISLFETTVFGLGLRNREAEKVIGNYAGNHRWLDVGVGIVGSIIPGASIPAMIACIAAQGPAFYKPMMKQLAAIYLLPSNKSTNGIANEFWFGELDLDLNNMFNLEFYQSIALELASEIGWGAAATFIPIVGGVVGAGLDARVAATMTWRVGTMLSIYFQNAGCWVENRKNTFDLAHQMVGELSYKATERVNLDDIPLRIPEVFEKQFVTLKTGLLDPLIDVGPDPSKISETLRKRGIPEPLIARSEAYIHGQAANLAPHNGASSSDQIDPNPQFEVLRTTMIDPMLDIGATKEKILEMLLKRGISGAILTQASNYLN